MAGRVQQGDEIDGRDRSTVMRLLDRVDALVRAAVRVRQATLARPSVLEDPFRGLHLCAEDVLAPLETQGEVWENECIAGIDWSESAGIHPPLMLLTEVYGLEASEIGALLLALAAEIDGRYGLAFAYLHDDVTRRAPSIGLLARLLHDGRDHVILGRQMFRPGGRLISHRLLRIEAVGNGLDAPVRVDPQILRFLLGEGDLDPRLAPFAGLSEGRSGPPLPRRAGDHVLALVDAAQRARGHAAIYLQGGARAAREMARHAAAALDRLLLAIDLARWPADAPADDLAHLLARETWLFGRLLLFEGVDRFRVEQPLAFRDLVRVLARYPGPVLLAGAAAWEDEGSAELGPVSIGLALDDADERRELWAAELAARAVAVADADLATLARRFRLDPGQIATAAAEIAAGARLQGSHVGLVELAAAARRRTGQALARLATRVAPGRGWDDLVLPEDVQAQLREIAARISLRGAVLDDWGMRRLGPRGNGTVVLFAGTSGTGKTLAAEILAGELALDLFRIDLARVVDKYIGETEKNLDRIFAAAEHLDAVLLFDEADALFGKRSEVKDAHDRYANLEIAYLLQKLEAYEGVAILSTNLLHNIDEAFIRRLAFVVHFPFPDELQREKIWRVCCVPSLPVADEVDFADLARRYRLSGGNIRNAVMAAAYLAAADGGIVGHTHLERAIAREYQKMGRPQAAMSR